MNLEEINKLIFIFLLIYLKGSKFIMKNLYYKFNDYAYNETEKFININLTMAQSKKKGLKYLKKIKTNKINNIKNQINKPKISVVIPLFNCQNTIDLTLKSIHFQNIKEIEIILINDCSLDNTSHIIKKFKNFDQRIKIINNLRNMGTFYSRCIGALKANGEYIIGIDNDDLFLSENIFETLYLNAKINFLDICEIKSFNIPNYNPKYKEIKIGYYLSHQDNIILHQPELGSFSLAINKNKVFTKDHFAWGKLIKASIYKKAINKLGKERYSKYNCFTEDVTIVFVLFNTADSFAYLNIFGIFHIVTNATTTFQLRNRDVNIQKRLILINFFK